jgi:predicted nucleic acid-binding protein
MSIAGAAAVMVDSCVLLDVITADLQWESWSAEQLRRCLIAGPVAINPLIYGEVAFAYERIEPVEEVLPRHLYAYWPIPREAAFLAARAHASYRARGGSRQMILPDFLIGAHALIQR